MSAAKPETRKWLRPPDPVPYHREQAEKAVRKFEATRGSKRLRLLPEGWFDKVLHAANMELELARECEPRAVDADALQLYYCYCRRVTEAISGAYVLANMIAMDAHSAAQAKRRKDKPATSDWHDDGGRNDRIRAMHARLVKTGGTDATAKLASEFDLSKSQIRRIVQRA